MGRGEGSDSSIRYLVAAEAELDALKRSMEHGENDAGAKRAKVADKVALTEAGKELEEFRNYEDSQRQSTVQRHYRLMRTHQTYDFTMRMHKKFCSFDKATMNIREAFDALGDYVDSSDPDSEFPNIEHSVKIDQPIGAVPLYWWSCVAAAEHGCVHPLALWFSAAAAAVPDCRRDSCRRIPGLVPINRTDS